MKRYLVPYEGSPLSGAALRHAVKFAQAISGKIEIVYIADERLLANPFLDLTVLALQGIGTLGDILPREQAKLELENKIISRGEDILKELKSWPELNPDEGAKPDWSTRIEAGNPIKLLSEISENYDVIFMGLWGEMHKFKQGLWGGTSEAVIRKGVCPVFLTTGEYKPLKTIIVGFDNRPRSRQALAWAGMIGEHLDLPVISLICGHDEDWRTRTVKDSEEIVKAYHTEYTANQTSEHPAQAILKESETNPDSLLCLGAFGDQPLREFFLGSVADEVLSRSKSPVMLFK